MWLYKEYWEKLGQKRDATYKKNKINIYFKIKETKAEITMT